MVLFGIASQIRWSTYRSALDSSLCSLRSTISGGTSSTKHTPQKTTFQRLNQRKHTISGSLPPTLTISACSSLDFLTFTIQHTVRTHILCNGFTMTPVICRSIETWCERRWRVLVIFFMTSTSWSIMLRVIAPFMHNILLIISWVLEASSADLSLAMEYQVLETSISWRNCLRRSWTTESSTIKINTLCRFLLPCNLYFSFYTPSLEWSGTLMRFGNYWFWEVTYGTELAFGGKLLGS